MKRESKPYFSNAYDTYKLAHQYLINNGWDHFGRRDNIEEECFTKITCKIKEKVKDFSGNIVGNSKIKVTLKNYLVNNKEGEGIPYTIISVKFKDACDDKYIKINANDIFDTLTVAALAIEAKYDYFESIREVGAQIKKHREFNYIHWLEDDEHETIDKIVNDHPKDIVLPITVYDLYAYSGAREEVPNAR